MLEHTHNRLFAALLITLMCLTGVTSADTDPSRLTIDDTSFPETISVESEELKLRGAMKLEYMFFDVYTAGFYVPEEVESETEMLDGKTTRQLVLHYHRSITRDQLIEATQKALKKNPEVDIPEIRDELNELYKCYQNVGEGDVYRIVYTEESGTKLFLNGEETCTIEGAQFATAFFGVWVSKYALDDDLSAALRGER